MALSLNTRVCCFNYNYGRICHLVARLTKPGSESKQRRTLCRESVSQKDEDAFQNKEVQRILKKITGLNLHKVYRPQKQGLHPPSYKLVSEKKLQELREAATQEAGELLQMPPVLAEREEINEVLSDDHTLRGLETSNIVFTDITYGLSERERLVVVREPNGVLRKATWQERDRMMQIYFPRPHRQIEPPPLFRDENLSNILDKEQYEFLLDVTCVQFEPDSSDFIRVHRRVYDHIKKCHRYDSLRSTRHFGGLAFYLTRNKCIEGLLADMIEQNLLDDAAQLVHLYHLLHPESASALQCQQKPVDGMDLVKVFVTMEATDKGKLELLIQQHETNPEELKQ